MLTNNQSRNCGISLQLMNCRQPIKVLKSETVQTRRGRLDMCLGDRLQLYVL